MGSGKMQLGKQTNVTVRETQQYQQQQQQIGKSKEEEEKTNNDRVCSDC